MVNIMMEEFVQRFQTFEGCLEIIQNFDTESILNTVSSLTGIPAPSLESLETETLGTSGGKSSYRNVLAGLKKTAASLSCIHMNLSDPGSRTALFSVIKYCLIPDRDFLKEAFSLETPGGSVALTSEQPVFTIKNCDEVKEHIEEIINMRSGEFFLYKPDSFLFDGLITCRLISALRKDLIYSFSMQNESSLLFRIAAPIPKIERLKKKHDKLKVVSISKNPGAWKNEELLKDKGLVPYFLQRDHGYSSTMVGADNGPYPYLSEYLQGMEMVFLPEDSPEAKCEWISNHAEDTDILIANGLYPVNMDILRIYQEKNPDGIIYLPLDANSEWMDRILHTDAFFSKILENVDVIGSSGRKMQRHLNEKWRWNVEYFPNGYYHPWIDIDSMDFDKKENIILTVGRLGTEQKATDVMLDAFAAAADKLPGWKLRLVGGIEPSFEKYIEDYYERYPSLKERVEFAGRITDKKELFSEYLSSKVFALTSILEGGTPNVVAEALHCGCAMATTEYDAFEDATDCGKCGMSAPIGNVNAMSEVFIKLCGDEDNLRKMCRHAFEYAESNYRMDAIVARIHDSLSGAV